MKDYHDSPDFPASAGRFGIHPPKLCASIALPSGVACRFLGKAEKKIMAMPDKRVAVETPKSVRKSTVVVVADVPDEGDD